MQILAGWPGAPAPSLISRRQSWDALGVITILLPCDGDQTMMTHPGQVTIISDSCLEMPRVSVFRVGANVP